MITERLHKRRIIPVLEPDSEIRRATAVRDAKSNAMLVTHLLLADVDLDLGDIMTVDVRILIERKGDDAD